MGLAQVVMRIGTGPDARPVKLTGGTDDGSVVVLEHAGAKSDTVREAPVVLMNHDGYVIAAATRGAPNNHGWYHNLTANPDSTLRAGSADVTVAAREVESDEFDEFDDLCRRVSVMDKRWEQYKDRTTRKIPPIHPRPR